MRILLLSVLFFSHYLYGITLDEIIAKSLSSNPSLESITARIKANKQNITLAKQFSDPSLLLTKNSIDSTQAMSQTVLTFKQKVPFFDKRAKAQNVALKQEDVLNSKLTKAKVTLVKAIKKQAYKIWELKELYSIVEEYELLTKQNIELSEAYTSTSSNQHMGIMSAQLTLSDLKIQKSTLQANIVSAYAKLSYLANLEVMSLELSLYIKKRPDKAQLKEKLTNNPDIQLKSQEILKQNAKVKVAELNSYPDFTILASYSTRENFDDYANIGIGITLPIYGTQSYKTQKQRAINLALKSQKEDTTLSVNSSFDVAFAQMLSNYEIYHIIQDEALPQLSHMFELSSSAISTGSDLFKYIDILIRKLKLEKRSIVAVTNFNLAEANIQQLKGSLK